jgi:hypothetical protein
MNTGGGISTSDQVQRRDSADVSIEEIAYSDLEVPETN